MSLSHSRYNYVRERIFKLFNVLNNRLYPVWIAPKTTMSIDDLRNRYERREEGFANDATFYDDHQKRKMSIPALIDILPNVTSPGDIGFDNANKNVVEIYESIQEYIALWCEIHNNAPEFSTPPITELRYLETLAYFLFPGYKKIKPFVLENDIEKQIAQDRAVNKVGLMGLGMLFSYSKQKQDISFISHLDALQKTEYVSADEYMHQPVVPNSALVMDSLSRIESSDNTVTDWLFRG